MRDLAPSHLSGQCLERAAPGGQQSLERLGLLVDLE
jgi:hypothetical protein